MEGDKYNDRLHRHVGGQLATKVHLPTQQLRLGLMIPDGHIVVCCGRRNVCSSWPGCCCPVVELLPLSKSIILEPYALALTGIPEHEVGTCYLARNLQQQL